MIVARPRAVPIPRPLIALGPTRLNLAEMISFHKALTRPEDWGDLHWGILQHIGDNEKTDHAPSYIDLIELGDTAISASHRDVFQGDVEIILRCKERINKKKTMPRRLNHLQQAFLDKAVLS